MSCDLTQFRCCLGPQSWMGKKYRVCRILQDKFEFSASRQGGCSDSYPLLLGDKGN